MNAKQITATPQQNAESASFTTKELLATFISHQVRDGERVAVGAGLHVPRAGILLAHLMRCPNVRLYVVMTFTNLIKEPRMEPFYTVYDNRPTKWAEGYILHDDFQEDPRNVSDTFVVGALQIDKFGNSNLIGVGKDYKHLDFRGPGAVGTLSMAHYVDRYYLFVQSHNRKIFVEKCDFISTVGWGQGGADGRSKLGIPGKGPIYCITPLCVFDFEEQSKRMRLCSVHPGVTVEQVLENTGFEVIVPDNVPQTAVPTPEELWTLRERIDIEGMLRN
jgi:glutaconate CoA-transferase subunit B